MNLLAELVPQRKLELALQTPAHQVADAAGDAGEVGGGGVRRVFDVAQGVEALEFRCGGGETVGELAALVVGHAVDGVGAVDHFAGDHLRGVGVGLETEGRPILGLVGKAGLLPELLCVKDGTVIKEAGDRLKRTVSKLAAEECECPFDGATNGRAMDFLQ